MMRYLSVCSGIEAATVAWHPLGWRASAYAEVDRFPSAVLAHHYPDVPNLGDMTRFREWPDATIDLLVGGTPCQSFSVAGLRAGLADPRGNLALTFLAIADRYRPRWVVWENVPGVLSSVSHPAPDPCPPPPPLDLGCDGAEVDTEDEYGAEELHAFNSFLAGFSELGYFGAYWTPDAQYFGLAQRRQRVFAVFHLGDWRRAAAVLFERESLSGHPAPRREAGEVAPTVPSRRLSGGGLGTDFDCDGGLIASHEVSQPLLAKANSSHRADAESYVAHTLNARGGIGRIDAESETFIAHSLRADGFDASEDGTGRGTPIVPTIAPCLTQNYGKQPDNSDTSAGPLLIPYTLAIRGRGDSHDLEYRQDGTANAILTPNGGRGGIGVGAVAFDWQSGGDSRGLDPKDTAQLQRCQVPAALTGMQVRRLTPRECERLQGFPDDYTLIPYRGKLAADGPRYKALGNSMAVPVMAWIGERIALVDAIPAAERVA